MRQDRLTQQYQSNNQGGRFKVRKNLLSTENCKLSRILGVLCCFAVVFGIVQYVLFRANPETNHNHKIIQSQPHLGEPDIKNITTQEVVDEAFDKIKQVEVSGDGRKTLDDIVHTKISEIDPENHYATLADEADSTTHFDFYGDSAIGRDKIQNDKKKIA